MTRRRLIFSVCVAVSAAESLTLLAHPPVETSPALRCADIVPIVSHVNIIENCDSHGFIELAHDPRKIVGNKWQARPLYLVLGWIMAIPFRVPRSVAYRAGLTRDPFSNPDPYYAGFVLLNWLLMVGAAWVFLLLVGPGSLFESRILLPLTILLVNEVTKAFFWTPHLQIFNVFVPLFIVAMVAWLDERVSRMTWRSFALVGVLLGLASLLYGVFVIAVLALTVALVRDTLRNKRNKLPAIASAGAMLAAFLVPIELWRWLVISKTGAFSVLEIYRYHQFVWITEDIAQTPRRLLPDLVQNIGVFLHTLPVVIVFPALVICGVVIAAQALEKPMTASANSTRVLRGILSYYAVSIPFYALMGFYATRLSWALVPPLALILSFAIKSLDGGMSEAQRRRLKAALAVMSCVYVAYWIGVHGPYS